MDENRNGGESSSDNDKIVQVREQVDQVVGIMNQNIEKVKERHGKLDELAERAEHLDMTSNVFRNRAEKIKRKMWWRNKRYVMILGGATSIVTIIVVLCLVL